jgi:hypothetical protein
VIQTKCKIDIKISPSWPKGKHHMFSFGNEAQQPTLNQSIVDLDSDVEEALPATPKKRHVPFAVVPVPQKKKKKIACKICGQSRSISLWLGCGYKPKRNKKECTYWVHQHCIGVYARTEKELETIPFYCKNHGPK